jgi:exosome complex component RRP42
MIDVSKVVSSLEKKYIVKLLKQGKRIDGRELFEFREIKIKTNFVPKAEGSADVFLGDTRVMCGVKYDIGRPYGDNPDKGVCTVMSEFLPIASPMFEPGRPGEDSIQLARVVDRGIRHTDCVNYEALCIVPKKHVYVLFVDCYMMDYFGNLTDAAAIAAIAALISGSIPGAKVDEEGEVVWDGHYGPIPIKEIPLSVTFGKIDGHTFVDPGLAEELCLDGRIAFAVDERQHVTSIQKYGSAVWSVEEIMTLTKKAIEIADGLREKLNLRQYIQKST